MDGINLTVSDRYASVQHTRRFFFHITLAIFYVSKSMLED